MEGSVGHYHCGDHVSCFKHDAMSSMDFACVIKG